MANGFSSGVQSGLKIGGAVLNPMLERKQELADRRSDLMINMFNAVSKAKDPNIALAIMNVGNEQFKALGGRDLTPTFSPLVGAIGTAQEAREGITARQEAQESIQKGRKSGFESQINQPFRDPFSLAIQNQVPARSFTPLPPDVAGPRLSQIDRSQTATQFGTGDQATTVFQRPRDIPAKVVGKVQTDRDGFMVQTLEDGTSRRVVDAQGDPVKALVKDGQLRKAQPVTVDEVESVLSSLTRDVDIIARIEGIDNELADPTLSDDERDTLNEGKDLILDSLAGLIDTGSGAEELLAILGGAEPDKEGRVPTEITGGRFGPGERGIGSEERVAFSDQQRRDIQRRRARDASRNQLEAGPPIPVNNNFDLIPQDGILNTDNLKVKRTR